MSEFAQQPADETTAINPTPSDLIDPTPAADLQAASEQGKCSAAEHPLKKVTGGRKGKKTKKSPTALARPKLSPTRNVSMKRLIGNQDRLQSANGRQQVKQQEGLLLLAQSMEAVGVLEPLIVQLRETTGDFVIHAGNRRFAAACLANDRAAQEDPPRVAFTDLPCQVIEGDIPEGVEHIIAFIENGQREDLSPLQKALQYRAILEKTGWSQNHLADFLGISKGTLSEIMDILNLPKDRLERVERGEQSPKKAVREWKPQQKAKGNGLLGGHNGTNGSAAELRRFRNGHGRNGAAGHVYEELGHRAEQSGFVFTVAGSTETRPPIEVVTAAVERWLGELRGRSCQGGASAEKAMGGNRGRP